MLSGLHRFEGRCALKTWIFHILVNRAKTRAVRERRSVPFSCLAGDEDDLDEPAVDPGRFLPADHSQWPGHWASPPAACSESLDQRLLDGELRDLLRAAIAALPDAQRRVIRLRDLEGWAAEEVCELLELSPGNQRVLLHRARSKVRAALERYVLDEGAVAAA